MTSAPGEDVPLRVLDFASLNPSVAVFGPGPAAADAPASRRTPDAIDGAISPEEEWSLNNPAAAIVGLHRLLSRSSVAALTSSVRILAGGGAMGPVQLSDRDIADLLLGAARATIQGGEHFVRPRESEHFVRPRESEHFARP